MLVAGADKWVRVFRIDNEINEKVLGIFYFMSHLYFIQVYQLLDLTICLFWMLKCVEIIVPKY